MTHTYNIGGMTCNGCVSKVKSELLKIGDITEADIRLSSPQATISMQEHISLETLQSVLHKAGNYNIAEAGENMHQNIEETKSWVATYKPVLLILFYISTVTVMSLALNGFDWMRGMQIFMSGFFLTFSFFKMLNLKGFAENYATYDIIAKKIRAWGFVYAFIELLLGIAFAINYQPLITSLVTFVVMTLSLIGVLQSVLNKRKIQCACLGAVFNLPMSAVTIIEDTLMILMSAGMLLSMLIG